MSMQDVARFFDRLAGDDGLRHRVQAALDERGEKAPFEIVDIAATEDLAFTATELREYLAAHRDAELSDRELETMTGGVTDIRSLDLQGLETIRLVDPRLATSREKDTGPKP